MVNTWSFFLMLGSILVTTEKASWKNHGGAGSISDNDEPLFLTPLIRQGKVKEAREKCRVQEVAGMDLESYAGLLMVRGPPDDANLFFWFFPAIVNNVNAPVFLLISGGPGISSMQMLFGENGPYYITSNGAVAHRTNHWATHFNVIYMDVPVGTGYSFARSIAAYNRNLTATARDLLEGILQLFTLFPEYAINDFYILGESYGGRCAAILAKELHVAQQLKRSNDCSVHVNLKGMVGMGPPLAYNHYSGMANFFHTNGLLTEEQYSYEELLELQFQNAVMTGDSDVANTYLRQLHKLKNISASDPLNKHRIFSTGFVSFMNLGQSCHNQDLKYYEPVMQQEDMRRALHVGATPFHLMEDNLVLDHLDDLWVSVIQELEVLMNQGYRVLLAYGTEDMLFVPMDALKMVGSLQWEGAAQFRNTKRLIWKLQGDSDVAGYVTPSQNLWFAFVCNSGHLLLHDKPRASIDLIIHFIYNNSTF